MSFGSGQRAFCGSTKGWIGWSSVTKLSWRWMRSPTFKSSSGVIRPAWCDPAKSSGGNLSTSDTGQSTFLVALIVHSGKMRGWCLPANDSYELCRVLPKFFYQYRKARRIHVIWDGGSSHVSEYTQGVLRLYQPQVRVLLTPAHASWLNQAELLLRSFASRYLDRGDWSSKEEMIDHLNGSWHEYNRLFAHPISWSWTRHDMHKWVKRHNQ